MTVHQFQPLDGTRPESNDPADIEALFTEDARYFTAPYRTPWSGRDEIVEGWLERAYEPGTWNFRHEVRAVEGDLAFVQGWTKETDDDDAWNLWVIRFVSKRPPPSASGRGPFGRAIGRPFRPAIALDSVTAWTILSAASEGPMYVLDLLDEFEAAARLVEGEGRAVAQGVAREPTLLAALERLDVVSSKLRAMMLVEVPDLR